MASVKDVLKLSAAILSVVPGGQPFAPIAGGAAALFPDDDENAKDKAWMREKVPEWMELAKKLMPIPMKPEVKAATHKGKIAHDWFEHYGEMPKERWLDRIHTDIMIAVKGDLAVAGLEDEEG